MDMGPDVDVMEKDREIAKHLTALRQPFFIKIHCSLVVIARANVAGECTAVAGNYLVNDAKRIGPNFVVDGNTKIDVTI